MPRVVNSTPIGLNVNTDKRTHVICVNGITFCNSTNLSSNRSSQGSFRVFFFQSLIEFMQLEIDASRFGLCWILGALGGVFKLPTCTPISFLHHTSHTWKYLVHVRQTRALILLLTLDTTASF